MRARGTLAMPWYAKGAEDGGHEVRRIEVAALIEGLTDNQRMEWLDDMCGLGMLGK
jgi:hypothetical protein